MSSSPEIDLGGSSPAGPPPAPTAAGLGYYGGQVSATGVQVFPGRCGLQEQVRLVTGNVSRSINVASVPSLSPGFGLTLTHHAQDNLFGAVGRNWRHSFESKLVVGVSLVSLITGTGQQVDFVADGSGGWKIDQSTSVFDRLKLANPSGTIWEVKSLPDETVWRYEASALPSYPTSAGRMIHVRDRFGNMTTLQYSSGQLSSITEQTGRQIQLGYTSGKVTSVTDPLGNLTTLAYDAIDNLVSVIGPEGCSTTFGYRAGSNQITSITDPRGAQSLYDYTGGRLQSVTFADGAVLRYRYESPQEQLDNHGTLTALRCTVVILPGGESFEFRFDNGGNLWRSISPSGHIKRYYWNNKQRFLYCNEGFPMPRNGYHGPSDNMRNRFTRQTVDLNGETIASLDSTGLGDTLVYDQDGRVTVYHPGQVHHGIQGAWPGHYGEDGVLLCAFNDDGTDNTRLPAYVSAVNNGDISGNHLFARNHVGFTTLSRLPCPRVPVVSATSSKRGIGFWQQSGAKAVGASFEFSISLTAATSFNLSLYSHSADMGAVYGQPFEYNREFGADLQLDVEDSNGVQTYRILNNAPGVWVTFPVQGDASHPIRIKVTATGIWDTPRISALAFDPHKDRRKFFTYTDGLLTSARNALQEWTYSYNPDGTLASVVDPDSNATLLSYTDTHKNLTGVTDAQSNISSMTYDSNGRLLSTTDARSNTTTMTYDGRGRLLTVTDALLHQTQLDYDENGNVVKVTDPKLRQTTLTYNLMNQLTQVTNALNETIRLGYDRNGRLASITDPRGATATYEYSPEGQVSSIQFPNAEKVSMAYDAVGQMVAATGPNGNQNAMELVNIIGAGNLFKNADMEVPPNGFAGSDPWNPNGNNTGTATGTPVARSMSGYNGGAAISLSPAEQRDVEMPEGAKMVARGRIKANATSGLNVKMLASVRDVTGVPQDHTQESPLDSGYLDWKFTPLFPFEIPGDAQCAPVFPALASFQFSVPGGGGQIDQAELYQLSQTYRYDTAGRLKRVQGPDGSPWSIQYDRLGRVESTEDPFGRRTAFRYDVLDRVIRVDKPEGEVLMFGYNGRGLLQAFSKGTPGATTHFLYDTLGRLVSTYDTIFGPGPAETFGYDEVGNLTSYTDKMNRISSFTYDELNRLTKVTYAGDLTTLEFDYDEVGNLVLHKERNGDLLEYTLDELDRVTGVERSPAGTNLTPGWENHYTYDSSGRKVSNVGSGGFLIWSAGLANNYGLGRYGQARYSGPFDDSGRPLGYHSQSGTETSFVYDQEGHRSKVSTGNGVETDTTFDVMGRPVRMITHLGASELQSIDCVYDADSSKNGQVIGNDTFDYRYDHSGRLSREDINRFVERGADDFANGTLYQAEISKAARGVLRLSASDTFEGNELNCDRWRTGFRTAAGIDIADIYGVEIRQNDGLTMTYPRAYCNRQYFLSNDHPFMENYEETLLANGVVYAESRMRLDYNFKVTVKFSDFQCATTAGHWAGLYISSSPSSPGRNALFGISRVKGYGFAFNQGNSWNYASYAADNDYGTLTLERKYYFDATGPHYKLTVSYDWGPGTYKEPWEIPDIGPEPLYFGIFTQTNASQIGHCRFDQVSVSGAYMEEATYISSVYDAGREVAWDRLSWDGDSSAQFQVAVADDPEGPWTFKGPGGSTSARFTSVGSVLGSWAQGRYCRYKLFFPTSGSLAASVEAVEISYSGDLESQSRGYEYSEASNLTRRTVRTDASFLEDLRSYNELDQLVERKIGNGVLGSPPSSSWTYDYDDCGNMISQSDGTSAYDYLWNEDNQLVGVELNGTSLVTYEYDSSSRLLRKVQGSIVTTYIWDGWDLVRKNEDNGSLITTTNYLVPNGELLGFEKAGSVYYVHGDTLSSTWAITDNSGDVVARYAYSSWGEQLAFTGDSQFGFFEHQFVGGLGCFSGFPSGLIYMRHRWYDPSIQRFISRDPIGLSGGANLYEYCGNRPTNAVDPTGLNWEEWLREFENPIGKHPLDPLRSDPIPARKFPAFKAFRNYNPLRDGQLAKVGPISSAAESTWEWSFLKSAFRGRAGFNTYTGAWSGGSRRIVPPSVGLILMGIFFSLNRVAKADACDKEAVAVEETAGHLGGILVAGGIMSTPWGRAGAKAIWASPYGRAAVVGATAYGSTRQFLIETEMGQVAEQFWYDTFDYFLND